MKRCPDCHGCILAERFSEPHASGVRYTCLGCANETEQLDQRHDRISPDLARRISEMEDRWREQARTGQCPAGHDRALYGVARFEGGRHVVGCRKCEADKIERNRLAGREYRQRQREGVTA